LPYVSFASAHALRARKRYIYAPPELYNNTHGNASKETQLLLYQWNNYCIGSIQTRFI